jgi:hypothetical protein
MLGDGSAAADGAEVAAEAALDVAARPPPHAVTTNAAARIKVTSRRALSRARIIVVPSRLVVSGSPDVGGMPYKTRLRTHPVGW